MSGTSVVETTLDQMHWASKAPRDNLLKEAEICKLTIDRVGDLSRKDSTLKKLKFLIDNGFPDNQTDLDSELKPFWNFRYNITEWNTFINKIYYLIFLIYAQCALTYSGINYLSILKYRVSLCFAKLLKKNFSFASDFAKLAENDRLNECLLHTLDRFV